VWAGFVVAAAAIVGASRGQDPAETRHIRQFAINRSSRIVVPAAVVSLVSGLYQFSALYSYSGVHSGTAAVLGVGASAAVLTFLVAAIGSRPAERRLAVLDHPEAGGNSPDADAQLIAKLDRRVVITARLTAALLLIATLAMAVARCV
jgi:hypothetical protein